MSAVHINATPPQSLAWPPLPPLPRARGLGVRTKLLMAVTAACATVLLLTLAAIGVLLDWVEQAAQLEAGNLATSVALGAVQKRPGALQDYVLDLNELYGRDLFIVDTGRRTIADIVPQELGETYLEDRGDEIGRTLVDGRTRTFVETSAQHPQGAKQLVVPLRRSAGRDAPIVGAVVLEYTHVERQLFHACAWALYAMGLAGLLAGVGVGCFGYRVASRLSRGIDEVRRGVLAFADGDTSVRLAALDRDEVGDLSSAFNKMADDLVHSGRELKLEAEIARQATEHAEYLAYTDLLTGLGNRTTLSRQMGQALSSASENGVGVGVLFIDLDRFKNVNDTLGHEAGDAVLKEVAARLRQCLAPYKHLARSGGDEFIVVVPELSAPAWLSGVARKILTVVAQPMYVGGQELRMTCSIGISAFPRDGEDEYALMKNADIALYRAKDEGRNGYAFYAPDIDAHSVEKLALESELRRAIELRQLSLHYQPKIDARSGRVCAVEALLRWEHPTMGSVPPARFIPVAEETGLILPLGRWVLEEACRQQQAWCAVGLQDVGMAVNLSARQLSDPELLDDVRRIVALTGIPPGSLELEITESLLMHNEASAMVLLHEFKRLGIRLAVDDFGTGYSSLAKLKNFPIDTLKIDRAFVCTLEDHEEDRAITQAIITMGKSLGLHIVAEGVETIAQCDFLRERGCDEFQGFYFSRAVGARELADMLMANSPSGRHAWKDDGDARAHAVPAGADL
jgi:diguanylate cyclase (GGDEF)-like protein